MRRWISWIERCVRCQRRQILFFIFRLLERRDAGGFLQRRGGCERRGILDGFLSCHLDALG